MKYILNEDGSIKVGANGHPMVDPENGQAHHELDAISGVAKIAELNTEAGNHRKEKTKYKTQVEAIPAAVLADPAAAEAALTTVNGLDDKLKADIEKVREEVKASFEPVLAERDATIKTLNEGLHQEKVGSKFAKSDVLKKTVLHPDIAATQFGSFFTLEDGKLIAKGHDGNQIYSPTKPGDPASFDEALDILIETSPIKDHILKAGGGDGDGSRGGGGGGSDDIATRSSTDNIKAGIAKLKS